MILGQKLSHPRGKGIGPEEPVTEPLNESMPRAGSKVRKKARFLIGIDNK